MFQALFSEDVVVTITRQCGSSLPGHTPGNARGGGASGVALLPAVVDPLQKKFALLKDSFTREHQRRNTRKAAVGECCVLVGP